MPSLITGNILYLIRGIGVSLEILFSLLVIGFVLGSFIALAQVYGPSKWYVQGVLRVYDRVLRGIPILILLFTCYFGISGVINIPPMLAAILALGVRSSAYQAQIFRSALQSIPPGQLRAARALGFTQRGAITTFAIPIAFRYAIGPWTNEFSSELKATSLVYVIGVSELMDRANNIVSNAAGHILLVFGVTAFLYLFVNKIGNSLLYALERQIRFPGFEEVAR